jgi:hypothetical protein
VNFLKRFWAELRSGKYSPEPGVYTGDNALREKNGSGGSGHVAWNPSESGFPPGTFSQGTPVPAFAPRHHYGGKGTLHKTSTVDVVLDEKGEVCQVWFRCLELPFRVDKRDHNPGYYNPGDDGYDRRIAIEEITYVTLPDEGSSQ